MKTTIDLDDQLLEEARRISGIKTKKEVVEQALRIFIQIQRQIKIRELRGKVQWDGDFEDSPGLSVIHPEEFD